MLFLEPALLVSRRGYSITTAELTVGAIGAILTLVCVLFHYEVMSWTSRLIPRSGLMKRARIVVMILVMLIAHVVEVWIFGITYWLLDRYPELGQLQGNFEEGLLDFIYFSVTSYTTLGFGDMVPSGAIRILCGTEALIGLSLITWSASLSFLEMQRDWREFNRPD